MENSWKTIIDDLARLQQLRSDDLDKLAKVAETSQNPERYLWRLVRDKKVTKHQALLILEGKGDRLQIDNYIILKPLGKGGMGWVYKARHLKMNRVVAIKTISPNVVKRGLASKRFENEIRYLSKLSHPNIVQAYDAGVHEGAPFLVKEYIDGIDLQKLVIKHGPLPLANTLRYLTQAAMALAYAHSNNIIHRDVKPANLIVTSDGHVKLLDLGIARAAIPDEDSSNDTALTKDNTLVGSIEYMSPEQLKSPRDVGPESDIYSLGCTLYFLLHGKVPFAGKTPMDFFRNLPQAPIPRLCEPNQIFSRELNSLFARLVAKTPEKRIRQMAEVAAALKRFSEMPEMQVVPEPASGFYKITDTDKGGSTLGSSADSDMASVVVPWYYRTVILMWIGVILGLSAAGGGFWYVKYGSDARDKGSRRFTVDDSGPESSNQLNGIPQPEKKGNVPKVQDSRVFRVSD